MNVNVNRFCLLVAVIIFAFLAITERSWIAAGLAFFAASGLV
jgi:hypothetical protein